MHKKEIVSYIAEKAGIKVYEAERAYESFVGLIENRLSAGEKITTGFGTLKVVARKEKNWTNPKTGEKKLLPEHPGIKFSPSNALERAVSGK